ncbi:MAG: hypothetical protein ACN4GZ_17815 [Acidimicrobiales bacterium]
MLSRPLTDALEVLRQEFPTDRVLIDELAADAALAIAATDLEASLVRLFELISLDQLHDREPYEVFDLLRSADWLEWDMPAVQAITGWADGWWLTTLMTHPESANAGDVLGHLIHLGLPMVKWLSAWLDELDGPGAQHLANFLIEGSRHDGWNGRNDERRQVLAWARSDAVVNGLTMIGATHLEPGQMAHVLDRIIVAPGLSADVS